MKWLGDSSTQGHYWGMFAVSSTGSFKAIGQTYKEKDDFGIYMSPSAAMVGVLHHKSTAQPLLSIYQVSGSGKGIIIFNRTTYSGLMALDLSRGAALILEPRDSRSTNHTHLKVFRRNRDCGSVISRSLPPFTEGEGESDDQEPKQVFSSSNGNTFVRITSSKRVQIMDTAKLASF